MKSQRTVLLALTITLLALYSPLSAAIIIDPNGTGATDVIPADPAVWASGTTTVYVGMRTSGELLVNDASMVESSHVCLGCLLGSTGIITIDGTGSTWTNYFVLDVGYQGSGTLNITNDATVSVGQTTYVARIDGATGNINFGDHGGTLTTRNLFCSPTQLTGTGTINTHSLVSDADLIFDATRGQIQTMSFNEPGQNITVNLNATGMVDFLGAGYQGNGSLIIRDGIAISSWFGYLGYSSGSNGTATINGGGSVWTNNSKLFVGRLGSGTVNVTNGGAVICNSDVYLGGDSDTVSGGSGISGVIAVDGKGSTWTTNGNSDELYIGYGGTGTLRITNAGAVVNNSIVRLGYYSGATGNVTVDGTESTWTNKGVSIGENGSGTLDVTNGGTVVSNLCSYLGEGFGSTGTATVDGTGSTWTSSSWINVGYSGSGTLNITNGGAVSNFEASLGCNSSSTGIVTVDGVGSTWTNSDSLYIGREGSGTLNITNGSAVSVGFCTYVAYGGDATGSINFGDKGGALTTENLFCSPSQLTGTGTINTHGLISDVDLIFDSTHGLIQSLFLNGQEQNITVNLDATNTIDYIGAGYHGNGSLTIRDGIAITSGVGYIGYYANSTGTVTVDGPGSTWTNTGSLDFGNGSLIMVHPESEYLRVGRY